MIEFISGIVSGIFTATGMGGGTVLIAILTLFLNVNQRVAQATNLIFFIPTSIIAIIFNIKNNNINLKTAIVISVFGIVGAILGATIAMNIDVKILKKFFGIFLAIIAIFEIFKFFKENRK